MTPFQFLYIDCIDMDLCSTMTFTLKKPEGKAAENPDFKAYPKAIYAGDKRVKLN